MIDYIFFQSSLRISSRPEAEKETALALLGSAAGLTPAMADAAFESSVNILKIPTGSNPNKCLNKS